MLIEVVYWTIEMESTRVKTSRHCLRNLWSKWKISFLKLFVHYRTCRCISFRKNADKRRVKKYNLTIRSYLPALLFDCCWSYHIRLTQYLLWVISVSINVVWYLLNFHNYEFRKRLTLKIILPLKRITIYPTEYRLQNILFQILILESKIDQDVY